MLRRYFLIEMPVWQFALNTLIASLLWLGPLLLLYVVTIPGFGPMLLQNDFALRLFLRQVLTNGLVVVFIVNYASFFLYASLTAQRRGQDAAARILAIDPVLRVLVFVALHALIYFASADWFGSFGGDHWLALRVVAPTLSRAALFANLSGVYLYATLASALPVYMAAIRTLRRRRRSGPGDAPEARAGRPAAFVLALCLFAASVLFLTGLCLAVSSLQAL